jgi:hypothetical protein
MVTRSSAPTARGAPWISRHGRLPWGVLFLVVAIAFMMNPVPGLGPTALMHSSGISTTPASPPSASAVAPAVSHSKAASSSSALAGTGPNIPAGAPNLSQVFRYASADLAAGAPSGSPGTAAPPASGAPSSAPASSLPAPGPDVYLPTGTFNGYVDNQSNDQPLSGVAVQVYPLGGGSFCPISLCSPVTTGSNGEYNVTCPVGPTYVTFTKSFFAENITFATCVLNTTVELGDAADNVFMDQDGIVIGTIEGDVNGTPGLGAVQVVGEARDYSIVALPGVVSSGDGAFRVPVPPDVAGRIDFTPAGTGYQNNFTWVTVGPGQTLNIGTVFLEPNSLVKARFYDSVTGDAINTVESLTLCSSVTATCGLQGMSPTDGGNTVYAVGPTG